MAACPADGGAAVGGGLGALRTRATPRPGLNPTCGSMASIYSTKAATTPIICSSSPAHSWRSFSVALGGLVFAWSRRLWGDAGGLLSLALYCFCPNFLAHAPLATSDVAMALGLLAACGAFWWQSRELTWKSGVVSVAVVALTAVTKFSFVLLLPIFARWWRSGCGRKNPMVVALGAPRENPGLARQARDVRPLPPFAHLLAAWAVIWAFFGFRYSAVGPGMPPADGFLLGLDGRDARRGGHGTQFFFLTRGWHLLPDAFLDGFCHGAVRLGGARGVFSTESTPLLVGRNSFPMRSSSRPRGPGTRGLRAGGALVVAAWRRAGIRSRALPCPGRRPPRRDDEAPPSAKATSSGHVVLTRNALGKNCGQPCGVTLR